jgi:hypothetical protein
MGTIGTRVTDRRKAASEACEVVGDGTGQKAAYVKGGGLPGVSGRSSSDGQEKPPGSSQSHRSSEEAP